MLWSWIERGGAWMWPLVLLSLVTTTLVFERLLWWFRWWRTASEGRFLFLPGVELHKSEIAPLAAHATSLGLLGNVAGLVGAFGGISGALDRSAILHALSTAFITTLLGTILSIVVTGSCHLFSLLAERARRTSGTKPGLSPSPARMRAPTVALMQRAGPAPSSASNLAPNATSNRSTNRARDAAPGPDVGGRPAALPAPARPTNTPAVSPSPAAELPPCEEDYDLEEVAIQRLRRLGFGMPEAKARVRTAWRPDMGLKELLTVALKGAAPQTAARGTADPTAQ
ncbi:MAG: MotA/TolQ/ExbB proton channel family protein [Planctomycetes bacterium]|nr:MotA/TolQ/ExbB proton channel family protein [Planctomycetota bacterium]